MIIRQLIGKVVPVLLLAYAIPAHSGTTTSAVLLYFHVLLVLVVTSYLRIYLAYVPPAPTESRSDENPPDALLDDDRSGAAKKPKSLADWLKWTTTTFFPLRLRDTLPCLLSEQEFNRVRVHLLHQCDSDGQLLRCWRDNCNGRFKPARTRHCGDCQTCRPLWDHHCPIFAADVIAKHTFASFFAFLFTASTLLISLFPLTWTWALHNTMVIWRFAWNDPRMGPAWWDKRWTWYGGPNLRYGGALIKARRMLNTLDPGHRYTITPCIVLAGAAGLTTVAILLALATLRDSLWGDYAVDRNRHSMWKKTVVRDQRANVTPPAQPPIKAATINSSTIQPTQNPTRQQDSLFKPDNFRSQAENEAVLSTPFSARKESGLSPWLYFWVPVDMFLGPQAKQCTSSALQQQVLDAGGLIVPIHELDRPYGQLKVSLHTLFDNIDPKHSTLHQFQPPIPSHTQDRLTRSAREHFDQLATRLPDFA